MSFNLKYKLSRQTYIRDMMVEAGVGKVDLPLNRSMVLVRG